MAGALALLLLGVAGYVPAEQCKDCHAEIWRSYLGTGMGRSFTRVESVPRPAEFYHAASDRYYRVVERDGKWFLQRRQKGEGGGEINVVETRIDYVVGSGHHARTYLHQAAGGRLVELPLSWYAEQGGYWAMSPGYDHPKHDDFRRQVSEQCLFCHNAYPSVAGGGLAAGIDCQRCHGPGEAHIRAARTGESPQAIRGAIVNPARLSPARRMEVCLQCHLETTSRRLPNAIRRYDREPFSYRPGEPLSSYVVHFDHPKGSELEDKFEVNHAGYRFLQSRCYARSAGRFQCTSCHDPHRAERGEAARTRARAACRGCHGKVETAGHPAGEDCIGCHMPKRRAGDAVHVVMTDHRIARKPKKQDPAAPLDEYELARRAEYSGEVVAYERIEPPGGATARLYHAVAQVKELANLGPGLGELATVLPQVRPPEGQFYLDLGEAYLRAGRVEEAVKALQEAIRRAPELARAQARLGEALLRQGRVSDAVRVLEKASHNEVEAAVALGIAYGQIGRIQDSIRVLREATRRNPDHLMAWLNLGVSLEQVGDFRGAEGSYREAIRVQPDFERARQHLGRLHSVR